MARRRINHEKPRSWQDHERIMIESHGKTHGADFMAHARYCRDAMRKFDRLPHPPREAGHERGNKGILDYYQTLI
jgi:hypothetical protein